MSKTITNLRERTNFAYRGYLIQAYRGSEGPFFITKGGFCIYNEAATIEGAKAIIDSLL